MTDLVKAKVSKIFSQRELAQSIGTSQQNISRWLDGNTPAKRVMDVCRATKWLITPHDIRPDIYPNPTDGLPPGMTITPISSSDSSEV